MSMSIAENVAAVRARIDAAAQGRRVLLVAASKMNDAERVREAVAAGVDACGENLDVVQDVLLEVNIGREAAKSGLAPEDVAKTVEFASPLEHVRVRGLMAIPPAAASPDETRAYFAAMRELFIDIGEKKYDNTPMDFLSMGMSGDFEAAIAEGANMVRVGSAIFGARDYSRPVGR